jgi:hypothetical protein
VLRGNLSLASMAAAEVYSPTAAAAAQHQQRGKVTTQAWQAVVGWIGFLLQVLLQILRGTPSCAQLLSFVGFRYPLLSATAGSDQPSPEVAFMPLRSEIPADTAPVPAPPLEPLERLTVRKIPFLSDSFERIGVLGKGQRGLGEGDGFHFDRNWMQETVLYPIAVCSRLRVIGRSD